MTLSCQNLRPAPNNGSTATSHAISAPRSITLADLKDLFGGDDPVIRLGHDDGRIRHQSVRLNFLGTDAANEAYAVKVWVVRKAADADTDRFTLALLTTLTVTLGTKTDQGALVGTSYLFADTVTKSDDDYATQLSNVTGRSTQIHSPADDTIAEVVLTDLHNAYGIILDADMTTAASFAALYEVGT